MEDVKLVGFIHKYSDGDCSIWTVNLNKEDRKIIDEVLEKYQNDGESVRGDICSEILFKL